MSGPCRDLVGRKPFANWYLLQLDPEDQEAMAKVKWEYSVKSKQFFPHLYAAKICATKIIRL
jgi:uncharacterized protein (DUF952 family)